jgi:hypothetical protein
MPHDNNQRHMQVRGGVFDAGKRDFISYVSSVPDHKKIADTLIENELHRYPRIGAT